MLGAILAATFKSPGQIELIVLTEEGVLRPLPPSMPDGVLQALCGYPWHAEMTRGCRNQTGDTQNKCRAVKRGGRQKVRIEWNQNKTTCVFLATISSKEGGHLNIQDWKKCCKIIKGTGDVAFLALFYQVIWMLKVRGK